MNGTNIGTLPFDVFQVVTSTPTLVVNSILHIIASIGSVIGNTLVILSVVKFKYLRSTIHLFVVSLACFDLALGVIGPFEQALLIWTARYGMLENAYLETLCQVQTGFIMCLGRGDWLSLSFMALDRFIYMVYPLRYPNIVTFNRVLIGIVILLVYPPVVCVFTFLIPGFLRPGVCAFPFMGMDLKVNRNYTMVEISIIGLALVCFYVQIAKLAWSKMRNNQVGPSADGAATAETSYQRLHSSQAKITKLIAFNVGVYILVYALVFVTLLARVSQSLYFHLFSFEYSPITDSFHAPQIWSESCGCHADLFGSLAGSST